MLEQIVIMWLQVGIFAYFSKASFERDGPGLAILCHVEAMFVEDPNRQVCASR